MSDQESLSTTHSSVSVDSHLSHSHSNSHDHHHVPVPLHDHHDADNKPTEQPHTDGLKKSDTHTSVFTDSRLRRPRKERRGLLAQLALIPEFNDARDYPDRLKGCIVFVIAIAAMIGPMGTSIVFPAIEDMKTDLNTTTMMTNVSVGIYLLSLGVFPIWWSSFSEMLGRRTVYVSSFTLYVAFAVGCALSPSIGALTGFRVLSGACSASVQSVGAGTISDLYPPEKRGRGMGYFYLGALASPLLSPIIGALLLTRWNWRSTQWFLVALSAVMDVIIILFLPETLRKQDNKAIIAALLKQRRARNMDESKSNKAVNNSPGDDELVISRVQSRVSTVRNEDAFIPDLESQPLPPNQQQLQRITDADLQRMATELEEALDVDEPITKTRFQNFQRTLYIYLIRPTKAVVFLTYPPVLLSISFSAITFGVLYIMNMTIEFEYARSPYDWKPLYVGLAYIPNSVTYIVASIYGGRWTDWLLQKYKQRHGYYEPEARISYNMLSAVITYPPALLITGWCFQYHTHWVTPLIGTGIFGYATMMTIGPTATYLVDSLPGRGATGMALNNLVRQTFATAAVFLVDPMINAMGTGPMLSMCCGVVLLWSVVLVVLKRKGAEWREKYDLQEYYDKLE